MVKEMLHSLPRGCFEKESARLAEIKSRAMSNCEGDTSITCVRAAMYPKITGRRTHKSGALQCDKIPLILLYGTPIT